MNKKVFAGVAVGFFLAGLVGMAEATIIQWDSASGGNDHYYQQVIFDDPGKTWEQANTAAGGMTHLGLTGHLATVTSEAENNFIVANLINTNLINFQNTWLGGTDKNTEGTWEWVTGETWFYTNWASAEPNNGDVPGADEDYLVMINNFHLSGNKWNDLNATATMQSYLVEYEPVPEPIPEPTTILLLGSGLVGVAGAARKRKKNQA